MLKDGEISHLFQHMHVSSSSYAWRDKSLVIKTDPKACVCVCVGGRFCMGEGTCHFLSRLAVGVCGCVGVDVEVWWCGGVGGDGLLGE